ncbi:MAG: VIT family protein [Rhodobacteraceae bacterium]|nr:VIT family protein [Paracoccaceae bacterium]
MAAKPAPHAEHHNSHRTGWLRAAVLGANDGIVSTGSLIVGVAAATPDRVAILVAGVAGLVAGAMSMASGEYVSVSSQADTERADLDMERAALRDNPAGETDELAAIYEHRGLEPALALQVAKALMVKDALGAHARDEIGITHIGTPKPVQAALASAASFGIGAALPLSIAALVPLGVAIWSVTAVSVVGLAVLGALSARAGGAPVSRAVLRVVVWGVAAMGVTALIGQMFGTTVG